ncbi:MAG: PHP domain-containing protein [Chloroflexota bacterium]|nr:MAG: PHP domain-containing protein [SAR202 cluster bacterium]MCH2671215.1 PHP domain-containing protein [Dehalococcoidia bacterium]MEE3014301.1 PHP domain-containing protein [Chloroflexota bacterium]GIS94218.1 MAG: phosphatase [Dehalococcoidia bacterium]
MSATIDLHLHTLASDGRLTPTELVQMVAKNGLKTISITDHDSTEGLAEAYEAVKEFPDLRIIPGIEMSADIPGDEVHVLGYFLDYHNEEFQATLSEFRRGRVDRAKVMVEKLQDLGKPVDWERVQDFAGDGTVGRPHIALAMVEAGYFKEPKEAFDEYLGNNGLAYFDRPKLAPAAGVEMIKKVGGVPVLAHPTFMNDMEAGISNLKKVGLVGMEVYYAQYDDDTVRHLARLAKEYDLIPCGGSDYHGLGNSGEPLPGTLGPPEETIKLLEDAAEKAKAERA